MKSAFASVFGGVCTTSQDVFIPSQLYHRGCHGSLCEHTKVNWSAVARDALVSGLDAKQVAPGSVMARRERERERQMTRIPAHSVVPCGHSRFHWHLFVRREKSLQGERLRRCSGCHMSEVSASRLRFKVHGESLRNIQPTSDMFCEILPTLETAIAPHVTHMALMSLSRPRLPRSFILMLWPCTAIPHPSAAATCLPGLLDAAV